MTSYRNSTARWTACALVPAMMAGVFLTGCSTLSESVKEAQAKELAKAGAKVIVSNDFRAPDVPKHLQKCAEQKPVPGTTADEVAINTMLNDEERAACYRALLKWYKGVQSATSEAERKK